MSVDAKPEYLVQLCALIEDGKIKPIIDRLIALEEVPQALQYLGDGRVKGKIVITI